MKKYLRGPLILAMAGLAFDQVSKFIAERYLSTSVRVAGDFFRLSLAHNYGFSFSLGAGLPATLRLILQVAVPSAVVLIIAFYLQRHRASRLEAFALSAIAAGAVGNLIDRVFRGYVVDFLLFKMYGFLGFQYWPTFNVADSFIVVGAITFALIQLFTPEAKPGQPPQMTPVDHSELQHEQKQSSNESPEIG